MARPDGLKRPEYSVPSASRYAVTAAFWYDGCANMFENPPDEKLAAASGIDCVAPTLVTLQHRSDHASDEDEPAH